MRNTRHHLPRQSGQIRRHSQGGFSLLEVMISSAIGLFVLAGVLSTFLMVGRSSQRLFYYNAMEAGSQHILEEFAQDVRMASNSTLNNAASLTLTVPGNYATTANKVTYTFGNCTVGSNAHNNCFYRRPGTYVATPVSSAANPITIYLENVTSCVFCRYGLLGDVTPIDDPKTKRIELTLKVKNSAPTVAAASDNIISANYLLRNK